MISIEDACQTYGVDRTTLEQWILSDGVDYRYIWQGDTKIRMIPRSWLSERTAGEGLVPQLIDGEGQPIGVNSGANVPVEQIGIEPSLGEHRALEMMQQVVKLQEYHQNRISKTNKVYLLATLVVAATVLGGLGLVLRENRLNNSLTATISSFTDKQELEKDKSILLSQLLLLHQDISRMSDSKDRLLKT